MLGHELNDQFYKKLTIIHNVIMEISNKKSLSAASENLLNFLIDNLSSISGSIHLYNEDKLFLLNNKGKGCANNDIPLTNEEYKRLTITEMPVEIKDIFLFPSIFKLVENNQFNLSLLMPMVSGDNLIGAVILGKKATIRGYSNEDKLMLAMICKQIATITHNIYLEKEVNRLNSMKTDLYIKSITDPLTGLYNRAHLEFKMREDIKVAKRYGRNLSALIIEIDNFFQISEMYGSEMTYHILQGISKTIEKAIRTDIDLPSRYSVDTIVVLLPETNYDGAMVLAERIRQKINNLHRLTNIENFPEISTSIGVATLEDKNENVEDILLKLKDALEQSKKHGKNKVFLCLKNSDKKQTKVFTTFETSTGINTDLLVSTIDNNNLNLDEVGKTINAQNAYKKVKYYQENVSIDWNPKTSSTEIKVTNAPVDDFSYQPMMFIDFITEEEKEKIKEEENKLPQEATEKAKSISNSINVARYSNIKKPPTNDKILVKKTQIKYGKIPSSNIQKEKNDSQIHSLGFIDEI
jgi:diguanylate cyclase (GGDEF)-like protein